MHDDVTVKCALLIKHSGAHNLFGDAVRVTVGGRAPVFHIATSVFADVSRDTHRCTSVSHAGREVVDAAGFMVSC